MAVFGVSDPAIIRNNVVLPQPDGPSSANRVPRSTVNDTSSTAMTAPKLLRTSTISSSAIPAVRSPT